MKPRSLKLTCVLVTSELREHRTSFLLSAASPAWQFARESVGLWRHRLDLRGDAGLRALADGSHVQRCSRALGPSGPVFRLLCRSHT